MISVPAASSFGANRLYIGSLHFNITEEELRPVFSRYGELDFINLHVDQETGRSKGYGFVQ
jgi:RNA-binding protein 39